MFFIFRIVLVVVHFISGIVWSIGELIENVGMILTGKQTHHIYAIVWEKSAVKFRTWLATRSNLK